MAIAAKPKRQSDAEAFIAGAPRAEETEGAKIVTTLRFNPALLKQIDKAAKKRGVSRSAWIMMAVSRAVEEGL